MAEKSQADAVEVTLGEANASLKEAENFLKIRIVQLQESKTKVVHLWGQLVRTERVSTKLERRWPKQERCNLSWQRRLLLPSTTLQKLLLRALRPSSRAKPSIRSY